MNGRRALTRLVGVACCALLVASVAALAACGGDNGDNGNGDVAETETEPTTPETPPAGSVLLGTVGPGFDISLTTEDGSAVSSLAPGTYELQVEDRSSQHNFHLTGPGVDVSTGVPDEGSETFEVELEAGTYRFVCDPHSATMSGGFEVG